MQREQAVGVSLREESIEVALELRTERIYPIRLRRHPPLYG